MSESFPYSGVLIVAVIRYAVVTHAWTLRPCRSSPMVRIADATIVWSSAARNMPSISPDSTSRIWRWLSCTPPAGPGSDRAAGTVVVLIDSPDNYRRLKRQESTGDRARDRARSRHHAESSTEPFDRTLLRRRSEARHVSATGQVPTVAQIIHLAPTQRRARYSINSRRLARETR